MKSKVLIIARDAEEFDKISKLLEALPDSIYDQIETAQTGMVGCECVLRQNYKDEAQVILPNTTTQIQPFGDYVGIYCSPYFFKITGDLMKKQLRYLFVQIPAK